MSEIPLLKSVALNRNGTVLAFFDSGIGGLSVVAEILKLRPSAQVIYFADTRYAPYGEKSEGLLQERASTIVDHLLNYNPKLITIACNTATAASIDYLRSVYSCPFVGIEPYINALHKEADMTKARVGLLATTFTEQSKRFNELKSKLDPQGQVRSYASKNLAIIIEKAFKQKNFSPDLQREMEQELAFLKSEGLTHLILGCTHYPLIQKEIEKYLGVTCLSAGKFVAKRIDSLLPVGQNHEAPTEKIFFFSSEEGEWREWAINQIPLWPKIN